MTTRICSLLARLVIAVSLFCGLVLSCNTASALYSIVDLGTLGGPSSNAYAINASGEVTGVSQDASGNFHAFLYDGTMHDLGTLGGTTSYGYSINSSGQVTGLAAASGSIETNRAFFWNGSPPMQDLWVQAWHPARDMGSTMWGILPGR